MNVCEDKYSHTSLSPIITHFN